MKRKLKMLSLPNVTLVDVRTVMEYQSGSVANSINIPMDEVVERLEELKQMEPMILFCRSGNRSEQVVNYLKQMGLKDIENGGGWLELNAIINEQS
ncbi:MAG: rhodanese-like domain-containing protein [Flavobacteriales bacterium]